MSAYLVCFGVRARALGLTTLGSQRSYLATIGDYTRYHLFTRTETAAHSRVDPRTHKGSHGALDARVVSAEFSLVYIPSSSILPLLFIGFTPERNSRDQVRFEAVWGGEAVSRVLKFHHRSAAKRQ